jgi:hypothetical protein
MRPIRAPRFAAQHVGEQKDPARWRVPQLGTRSTVPPALRRRCRGSGHPSSAYLVSKGPGFLVGLRAELLPKDLPAPLELPESRAGERFFSMRSGTCPSSRR